MPAAIVAVPVMAGAVAATEVAMAIMSAAMLDELDAARFRLAQTGEACRCRCGGSRGTAEGRSKCQKSNNCKTFDHDILLAGS